MLFKIIKNYIAHLVIQKDNLSDLQIYLVSKITNNTSNNY